LLFRTFKGTRFIESCSIALLLRDQCEQKQAFSACVDPVVSSLGDLLESGRSAIAVQAGIRAGKKRPVKFRVLSDQENPDICGQKAGWR
jgi:hypothetical protein